MNETAIEQIAKKAAGEVKSKAPVQITQTVMENIEKKIAKTTLFRSCDNSEFKRLAFRRGCITKFSHIPEA